MKRQLSVEDQYWVWLSGIEGMTARRFYEIVSEMGSAEEVFRTPSRAFEGRLGPVTLKNLTEAQNAKAFDAALASLEKSGASAVSRSSELYPPQLSNIYDPPPVLYILGDDHLPTDKAVAVVGSRNCTRYGEDAAMLLCDGLARAEIAIVSGLARGIDAVAHMGCLRGGGFAIAVLGNGPDIIYPPEHSKLYHKILETGGSIVSEYPPGMRAQKHYFPARNRIISGLSRAVLLVEADEGSGALHTVEFAAEQGRDLFVVPGPITSKLSSAPNRLLREGAKPAIDISDIINEFSWSMSPEPKAPSEAVAGLDQDELLLLACLGDENFTPTELASRMEMSTSAINTALTRLEMRGIIRRSAGNLFRKAR